MSCCDPKNKPTFRPNFREKPITEKFYARHDALTPDAKYRRTFNLYLDLIAKRQKFNPHDERLAPLTENQMYGWLSHLAENYSTGYDPMLFNHHLRTNMDIKTQLRVINDLLKDRKHS